MMPTRRGPPPTVPGGRRACPRVDVHFTLDELADLDRLATAWGVSRAAAIRKAVEQSWDELVTIARQEAPQPDPVEASRTLDEASAAALLVANGSGGTTPTDEQRRAWAAHRAGRIAAATLAATEEVQRIVREAPPWVGSTETGRLAALDAWASKDSTFARAWLDAWAERTGGKS